MTQHFSLYDDNDEIVAQYNAIGMRFEGGFILFNYTDALTWGVDEIVSLKPGYRLVRSIER